MTERSVNEMTEAELLAAADSLGEIGPDDEDGFMSSREWAVRWSCGWRKAQERVRKLIAMGHMECRWSFRDTASGRRQRRATYGWVIQPKDPGPASCEEHAQSPHPDP